MARCYICKGGMPEILRGYSREEEIAILHCEDLVDCQGEADLFDNLDGANLCDQCLYNIVHQFPGGDEYFKTWRCEMDDWCYWEFYNMLYGMSAEKIVYGY